MNPPDLTGLPADELLDAYSRALVDDALRRRRTGRDWCRPEAGGLRAELLRRLADRDRLAAVVRRALEAGHCHPAAGSDAGECLVDHCALALRDLVALRQNLVRLLEALVAVRKAAALRMDTAWPQGGSRAVLEQIAAAATAALAANEG